MPSFRKSFLSLVAVAATISTDALQAQMPIEGPVETSATISVDSKRGVELDPKSLKLEVNGHDAELTGLTRIQPSTAQIAILIDDGLRSSFGTQLDELKRFVSSLPAGSQVLVGYMRNGTVVSESGFSSSHQEVASQIRIAMSVPGASASPYFCLSDFVKKWPSNQPGSRFVLMLTNGVDPYNGSTSIMNQNSPYVQAAQDDAQRAGVAVYAIAYGDAGMRGALPQFSGQNYLQQVADATGGRSLYNGSFNPVSIGPYLSEFSRAIVESYTATFMASANREKSSTLTRIKITSSQKGIKIHAPDGVHPGRE